MRRQGWVNFERPPSPSTRALLESYQAVGATSAPLTWSLPSEELARVVAGRASVGEGALFGVRHVPGPEDDPAQLAAYLPLADLDDVQPPTGTAPLLAFDGVRSLTVGNEAAAELLALPEQAWRRDSRTGDLLVLDARPLPDPIVVAQVIEMFEGTRAFFVRSDGDERISARNLDHLVVHGLATTEQCLVEGRTRHWVRPLVVRGDLLQRMLASGVRGLLEPEYLVPLDGPLPG